MLINCLLLQGQQATGFQQSFCQLFTVGSVPRFDESKLLGRFAERPVDGLLRDANFSKKINYKRVIVIDKRGKVRMHMFNNLFFLTRCPWAQRERIWVPIVAIAAVVVVRPPVSGREVVAPLRPLLQSPLTRTKWPIRSWYGWLWSS